MIFIASDLIGFCSVYAPFDYLYKKTLAKFIHICNYVPFFFFFSGAGSMLWVLFVSFSCITRYFL